MNIAVERRILLDKEGDSAGSAKEEAGPKGTPKKGRTPKGCVGTNDGGSTRKTKGPSKAIKIGINIRLDLLLFNNY